MIINFVFISSCTAGGLFNKIYGESDHGRAQLGVIAWPDAFLHWMEENGWVDKHPLSPCQRAGP
jgi:hypothetical protein